MSRNGSGTYTLPAGNPVVTGTTIESTWANTTLSDIATTLTDSLSRSGQGGMTAALRIADGTQGAPGLAFANETGSGLYRDGTGEVWAVVQGVQTLNLDASGVTVPAAKATSIEGTFVFNETGADKDARFEGDTDANLLFVDASTDRVGVGTNAPATKMTVRGATQSQEVALRWERATDGAVAGGLGYFYDSENSVAVGSITNHPFKIITNDTTKVTVDTSGNLGIGTSSPVGKVDAVANAYAAFVARASTSGAGQTVDALKATDSAASNFANAKYTANEHIWNYAGASEGMRLDASGNFAVGSTPSSSVKVFGLSGNNQHGVYGQTQGSGTAYYGLYGISTKSVSSGGAIGISTNGTTYGILGYNDGTNQWAGYFVGSTYATGTYQGSDARLKENVQPLSGSLQKLAALRPVKFDWKQNSDPERNGIKHDVGLIAQEVLPVLPDVIKEVSGTNPLPDSDPSLNSQLGSFYTIEYTKLIPHLISAIQEQQAIIEDLRARVAALEAQ